MQSAASGNNYDIVKLLLTKQNIDVNRGPGSPLFRASMVSLEMVKLLLSHSEVDVNLKNGDSGMTALMMATSLGKVEIVETLLKNSSVNVNMEDDFNGRTALYIAASADINRIRLEMVKLILTHPDINVNKGVKRAKMNLYEQATWHNESELSFG